MRSELLSQKPEVDFEPVTLSTCTGVRHVAMQLVHAELFPVAYQ